jgi:hypothetical protein
LEEEDQHEKAAALAVFHFDLKRAVQSLNRAATKKETRNGFHFCFELLFNAFLCIFLQFEFKA